MSEEYIVDVDHLTIRFNMASEMDVYYDSLSFSISCHIGPGGYGVGISVIGEYDL